MRNKFKKPPMGQSKREKGRGGGQQKQKGKERKGKERKGKERKGKERNGICPSLFIDHLEQPLCKVRYWGRQKT
jgi:hypothetical protein